MTPVLRRQKGETERHYLARKIFLPYLEAKQKESSNSKLLAEFPPYGGRARSDLAVITEKRPVAEVEIWVEIQDTKLSKIDWREKLAKVDEAFKPKSTYVVITENLASDSIRILKIVSTTLKNYDFYLVDTKKALIYNLIWGQNVDLFRIEVKNGEIYKKRIKVSLEHFLA